MSYFSFRLAPCDRLLQYSRNLALTSCPRSTARAPTKRTTVSAQARVCPFAYPLHVAPTKIDSWTVVGLARGFHASFREALDVVLEWSAPGPTVRPDGRVLISIPQWALYVSVHTPTGRCHAIDVPALVLSPNHTQLRAKRTNSSPYHSARGTPRFLFREP